MNIIIKNINKNAIELSIKGKNVDYSTVNTLRRVILSEIPCYGLNRKNIFIENNTSVFDNDLMRIRISMLTIPDLKNDENYLHESNADIVNDDSINIYLNEENIKPDIFPVTTDHLIFMKNGEKIKNPFLGYKPSLIIKLKPEQKFNFRAIATLGKARMNNLWAVTGPCYYKEKSEDDFNFFFETLGQLTHKEILVKACNIVVKKLEEIQVLIGDNYKSSSLEKVKKIELTLENEDHTMGNLITTALQNHNNVVYAGFKKDHLMIDEIIIRLETTTFNPLKTFFEIITNLKDIYTKTKRNIEKLDFNKNKVKVK